MIYAESGYCYFSFITINKDLFVCGENETGQLVKNGLYYIKTPCLLSKNVTNLCCGEDNALYITEDNTKENNTTENDIIKNKKLFFFGYTANEK